MAANWNREIKRREEERALAELLEEEHAKRERE